MNFLSIPSWLNWTHRRCSMLPQHSIYCSTSRPESASKLPVQHHSMNVLDGNQTVGLIDQPQFSVVYCSRRFERNDDGYFGCTLGFAGRTSFWLLHRAEKTPPTTYALNTLIIANNIQSRNFTINDSLAKLKTLQLPQAWWRLDYAFYTPLCAEEERH